MAVTEPPPTVVPVQWPDEATRREELAAAGVPRLLLVAPGARPPASWSVDEDWIQADAASEERAHREATLRRRLDLVADPPPRPHCGLVVDEDGLARRDGRWVALSDLEVRLLQALLRRPGRCIPRPELLAAAWPGEARPDRAVDGAIRRVRAKVAPLGVRIHGITGVGYLLEVASGPAA